MSTSLSKPQSTPPALHRPRASPVRATQAWSNSRVSLSLPSDTVEKEADEMARAALSGEASGTHLPASVLRSPLGTTESQPESVRAALCSGGSPLSTAVRAFFEPRLGCDFSTVRVHTDTAAAESARMLSASAYTWGNHIVFGRDRAADVHTPGSGLLAHELAHVTQQAQTSLSRGGSAFTPDSHAVIHRRITPEDVAAEMQGMKMALTADFTAGEVTLTKGATMIVEVWQNSADTAGMREPPEREISPIVYDIPKVIFRRKRGHGKLG